MQKYVYIMEEFVLLLIHVPMETFTLNIDIETSILKPKDDNNKDLDLKKKYYKNIKEYHSSRINHF